MLRHINDTFIPMAPIVSDVPSILTSIPAHHTYFTVVDLCSNFFSVPVHENKERLFPFRGNQFIWTHMPQGYTDFPKYLQLM